MVFVFGYTQCTNQNVNDLGLKVFQSIKTIKGDKVHLSEIENLDIKPIEHSIFDELLKKYVALNGNVNYNGFIEDSVLLNQYLQLLSNHPAQKSWSQNEQLAYWINAYNAFTIKLILENYPLQSIKDIAGNITMVNSPWDIKFFKIGGVSFDLNTIEHEILRKDFNEPRIHFAINCASVSCPKLRNEAYIAAKLDEQLHDQTVAFLNSDGKNEITATQLKLSKIFSWFESDFNKNQTIVEFLQPYTKVKIKANAKISYLAYDWNLNE